MLCIISEAWCMCVLDVGWWCGEVVCVSVCEVIVCVCEVCLCVCGGEGGYTCVECVNVVCD